MRVWAAWLAAISVAACSGIAPRTAERVPVELFDDRAFAVPAIPVDAGAALAVTPAMRAYLAGRFPDGGRTGNRLQRLVEALRRGDLKLEYDAAVTRTAAEAFDARAGNCMALVLMTAAFAKELGLVVHYRQVVGPPIWDRAGDVVIGVGHVDLELEERPEPSGFVVTSGGSLLIDFLPPADARTLRTRSIDEATVLANFLNNRAVESLTAGRLDDAYAYARAAVERDPAFAGAVVTLGVVYRSARRPELAERAYAHVLARDPDDLDALRNRAVALADLGRTAEAEALRRRLATLEPAPPFGWFQQGLAAYREGRYDAARGFFEREVERAPYHHAFEFWLAATYAQQHQTERAMAHLTRAMNLATTRGDHDLYAGKLARLQAARTVE